MRTASSPARKDKKQYSAVDICPHNRHVRYGMLVFVGMDALRVSPFEAFGPARASEDKRREYLDCYGRRLLALETTPPLHFS